ncbi:hypothetical protein BD310DRAFT_911741 [Dichomitus squalens]|uniref:Uncharacterized protein n=1 Tax=Dichomitus squalens TaxID=114155 RepID=A0A4Q9QE46_9APHY|nr:hypothetical protein BD310DRAFT_911741 [Dichomitus squalens]
MSYLAMIGCSGLSSVSSAAAGHTDLPRQLHNHVGTFCFPRSHDSTDLPDIVPSSHLLQIGPVAIHPIFCNRPQAD